MGKKGKRTKGIEEAQPFAGMSQVNPNAAGVDIGAVEIVACVAGDEATQIVKAFGNYTVDLQALGKWLHDHHIKTVAMESTGVYWKIIHSLMIARKFVARNCSYISLYFCIGIK